MKFTYHPLTSVMIAVAVGLSLLPLGALIERDAFVVESLPVLVASAVVGLILALLRAPRLLTLIAQLVAIVGVLVWRGLSLAGPGDPFDALSLLTSDGVEAIRNQPPPLSAVPGVVWLVLLLASVLTIVLELLVNGLEQPGWAIAPLALSFTMSALIVRQDLPWYQVLPVLAGYLAVLLASGGFGGATGRASRSGAFNASRTATALAIAAIGVIASLLIAPLIPLGPKQPWNNSGQDGPIQLSDPTVRLNQDLRRPDDVPVLNYRASNDEPTYLRTVALANLTSDGARLMPMRLSRFGLGSASNQPGVDVKVEVQMADIPSEYLPAPFAPRGFSADGTWSYDPETLSIVAAGVDRIDQTRGLEYSVESVIPDPTKEEVEAAGAGSGLDAVVSEIPQGLSPEVTQLTSEVVGDAQTAGQKALAIQSYLRSDQFTYSLGAPGSSSSNAINAFLLEDRSGYCIHFAAAMITMSRIEGIPARMAVGFTPGERQEDGSYEVTAHDAHAWPELYLDGLGWVPFEPTPAFDGPPEYVDPADPSSASPTPEPTAPTSEEPAATPTPTPTPSPTPSADPSQGAGGRAVATGIGIGALVLLLLALPALARLVQRGLRLRGGQEPERAADAAWDEVRATFRDFGLSWPGGSPGPASKAAADQLAPQGAAALAAIAQTVERSRFSREGSDAGELATQVKALRTSVSRAASSGARFRAVLLPASLFGSARRTTGGPPDGSLSDN